MLDDSFKRIADESPSMLWVSDENKGFVFFNKAWLQFRGTSLEDEIALDRVEAVSPHDFKKVKKTFEKSFEERKPYKLEYRLKNNDGSYRWVFENGTPQYSDKKEFNGFIGSCMDIHSIKELERRKDEFVTAASHELKTPLTSLSVYIHLIDEYFRENPINGYADFSEGAILQVKKITSLVERLVDMNKVQSGSLDYTWTHFSMENLVCNVVEKISLLYPRRRITYNHSTPAYINGDFERLSQAVENLLLNAIKFSSERDEITVNLRSGETGTTIMLDVIDRGIGIENEYQSKIFDRFFRISDEREQTYPGLGMGLYLTKKIIEKHKGEITVDSKKDEFTKFSITIPTLNTP